MNSQTHTNPFAVVNQNKCYMTVLDIDLNILFNIQIEANISPFLEDWLLMLLYLWFVHSTQFCFYTF